MRYAVTGGAGFIGSHLVSRLCLDHHDVVVIDNLSRGNMSNLKDVSGKMKFIRADITDYDDLDRVLQGMDGIFHLAALTSIPYSFDQETEYRRTNVMGTDNVFRVGLESQIKIVFASSSSVYGNVDTLPIPENSAQNPLSPYAVTKYEGDLLAENYTSQGAQIVALRYFNVIGIGRALKYAGVIPKFLDVIKRGEPPCIFGDGSLIRDFVDVNDTVRATVMAMESDIAHGFFNIGTGQSTSIDDLARMMINISGFPLEPKYDKPRRGDAKATVADVTKSRVDLGWTPTVLLEDSIKALFRD